MKGVIFSGHSDEVQLEEHLLLKDAWSTLIKHWEKSNVHDLTPTFAVRARTAKSSALLCKHPTRQTNI